MVRSAEKVNLAPDAGEAGEDIEEGVSWENPGSFPEFAGDKATQEDSEDFLQAEKVDGAGEKDVGEKLWALFSDPEISVGVHGTVAETDSGLGSEDSPFFTTGVGCRYGDLRRTIAFQDRGRIHAHGNITFPELLSYNYPASLQKQPLTIKKTVPREETVDRGTHKQTILNMEEVEVPAKQFSVIVAIPKSVGTTDPLLRGEEMKVAINNPFAKGEQRAGAALRSEFVVGVMTDANPETIVWNPNFDAEKVREISRQRRAEEEQKASEQTEAEEEHSASEQEQAPQSKTEEEHPTGLVGKFLGRFRKRE